MVAAVASALAGAIVGWLLADFASGVVHWVADSLDIGHRGWLQRFCLPFRQHHADPTDVTRHHWVEANWLNVAAAIPIAAAACIASGSFLRAALASLALGVALATASHRWAHAYCSATGRYIPPLPVRWLQRCHLLLAPAAHASHHQGANADAYCVLSGWWNPLLDGIGFWRQLERLASTVGIGARSNAD